MRFSLVTSAILAVALFWAPALAHEGHDHDHDHDHEHAEGPSDVLSLTKDTFATTVDGEPLMLVEFFAPWCGHCKALAPEYEKAATALAGTVKLAKVDCTVEQSVCEENGVRGYPTLRVFRNGTPSEFNGQRTSDSIISYMKKQLLPPVSLLTAENAETFAASERVVVISFLANKDHLDYVSFAALAEELRNDYVFGHVADAEVAAKFGITEPSVVLFKKFDEGKNVLPGGFGDKDALKAFVKTNSVPLMDDIGPNNYHDYIESGLPLAYLFVSSEEDRAALSADVEAVAKAHKGAINFVYIDAGKFGSHAKNLNLKEEFPAFAIQTTKTFAKYPLDQSSPLTGAAIKAFVEEFAAGNVQPSLKSEPIPEKNDEPVKVIVGKQFEEIVLDKTKHVFVEFYAPWCGHCKRLAPIWDELGEKFQGNGNVVIAKMDATENDLPTSVDFQIHGFPTLKFFAAGTNEVVDYDGERTLEALTAFVEEHTATKAKETEENDEL